MASRSAAPIRNIGPRQKSRRKSDEEEERNANKVHEASQLDYGDCGFKTRSADWFL